MVLVYMQVSFFGTARREHCSKMMDEMQKVNFSDEKVDNLINATEKVSEKKTSIDLGFCDNFEDAFVKSPVVFSNMKQPIS